MTIIHALKSHLEWETQDRRFGEIKSTTFSEDSPAQNGMCSPSVHKFSIIQGNISGILLCFVLGLSLMNKIFLSPYKKMNKNGQENNEEELSLPEN